MPTFAGFFASYDNCRAWLQQYAPEILRKNPWASTGAVERKAEEYMKRRRIRNVFYCKNVPWPVASDSNLDNTRFGLMLGRRWSEHREYFAPDPVHDLPLRERIEEEFGLKVTEWVVIWYLDGDPDMKSEFVLPEAVEGA
ncbi:hypothetical protein FS749_014143 [Ceratobasidium sp. UAMH 11750]|nr:hypothetical protein FS749_014143 [Ceratobasidium sp. UAMH 11750]